MEKTAQVTSQSDKLDFKKILPVFVIILIDLMGLTIIVPLMPLYAASFGASAVLIGFLGAAYPAAQVIGAPILGRLSDRFGRKPILLASQIGTFIGFIVLGMANSLWLLFLARVLDGLSGANVATAQAVITDSTNEKTRTQGLGLVGAAFGLGFIIGPVISFVSLALGGNNYHVPAFVAAGFSLISILLTIFMLKETHKPDKEIHLSGKREIGLKNFFSTLQKPLVGFLLVTMFFQQIAFGSFQQILSLFTLSRLGLTGSGNSIIYVFVGIVVVSVQGYFIGKWSRRFGEKWLIRFGLIMISIGLLLTSLTPRIPPPWYSRQSVTTELSGERNLAGEVTPTKNLQIDPPPADAVKGWFGLGWILLAMVPAAIGGGVLQPSINSLLTRNVDIVDIGGTLGISAALLSAANALAPVMGGVLFGSVGPSAPFMLSAGLAFIVFLFSIKGLKMKAATSP